MGELRSLVPCY